MSKGSTAKTRVTPTASVQELQALFDKGFDGVSSNVTPTHLHARAHVNQARGVSPP